MWCCKNNCEDDSFLANRLQISRSRNIGVVRLPGAFHAPSKDRNFRLSSARIPRNFRQHYKKSLLYFHRKTCENRTSCIRSPRRISSKLDAPPRGPFTAHYRYFRILLSHSRPMSLAASFSTRHDGSLTAVSFTPRYIVPPRHRRQALVVGTGCRSPLEPTLVVAQQSIGCDLFQREPVRLRKCLVGTSRDTVSTAFLGKRLAHKRKIGAGRSSIVAQLHRILKKAHVEIVSDSAVAVFSIRNWTSRSSRIIALLRNLRYLCEQDGIKISTRHLPRMLKFWADRQSRMRDSIDWMLHSDAIAYI